MVGPRDSGDNWSEWRKYVYEELKRQGHQVEEMNDKLGKLTVSLETLKLKAGFWGALAGSIPALVVALLIVLRMLK